MMFGSWGNTDEGECLRIAGRFLDAGVNLVDSADVYGSGHAESVVGKAIRGRRHELIIATKFHGRMGEGVNQRGASRVWMRTAVEESLRRLDVECIDLYQMHRPEAGIAGELILETADELIRAGKIAMFGVSNFPARDLVLFERAGRVPGAAGPVSIQSPYSLFNRGIELETLPAARQLGLGVLAFSPLNGGWLTGKYASDRPAPTGSRARTPRIPARFDFSEPGNARKFALLPELERLARQAGMTLAELALAWAGEHPAVTCVLLGPRTPAHAEELVKAVERDPRLSPELLDELDRLIPVGEVLNPADNSYPDPAHSRTARRRPCPDASRK